MLICTGPSTLLFPVSAYPQYSNILSDPNHSDKPRAAAHRLVSLLPLAASPITRGGWWAAPPEAMLTGRITPHMSSGRPTHPQPRLAFCLLCQLVIRDSVCGHKSKMRERKLCNSGGSHGSLGHLLMQTSCALWACSCAPIPDMPQWELLLGYPHLGLGGSDRTQVMDSSGHMATQSSNIRCSVSTRTQKHTRTWFFN